MIKLEDAVKRETLYVASWVVILSFVMQAIFLLIGSWDLSVLFGNVFSAIIAVLNFLLMGITVQKAVASGDEKQARNMMKTSHSLRTLMLFVAAALGALLPCFHILATLIPLLFPRVAFFIRGFSKK